MNLSAQELNSHFLMLPEQEQQKVIDLVLKKYIKKQLKLLPYTEDKAVKVDKPRKLGLFKGQIKMADDFNEPLPDSFWLDGKL